MTYYTKYDVALSRTAAKWRTGFDPPRGVGAAALPSREEQDALAETIRIARVIAREEIARAGGVGLAAYLAALQRTVAAPTVTRKTRVAGSLLRGCKGRPAAGIYTREAIDFLVSGDGVAAAELDLEADPGCGAIDAARAALIELLACGGTPADRQAREAIRDFDREVCAAAYAIRGALPRLIHQHRIAWGRSAMPYEDAEAAAQDGAIKACSVYRYGSASLATYTQNHGWIFKALREAEPTRPTTGLPGGSGKEYASRGPETRAEETERELARVSTVSVEQEVIAAEEDQARSMLGQAILAAGIAASEGANTATAQGLRVLAAGEHPPKAQFAPAVRYLRRLAAGGTISISI